MPVDANELRASPLFADFNDAGLTALGAIVRQREVPRGMSVFIEGAPGDSLFVLRSGSVNILSKKKVLLTLETPGEHFGELALLRASRRQVSARAHTKASLFEVRRTDFAALLKQKPQVCMKLMLAIAATIEGRVAALKEDLLAGL